MLRKIVCICIGVFSFMTLHAFTYYDDLDFLYLDKKKCGIKKIIERKGRGKKVLLFDENGFLIRSSSYRNSKNLSDYDYTYGYSLSTLDSTYVLKDTMYQTKTLKILGITNYYYNRLKQCYRVERYSSENLEEVSVLKENFIYKDNQIRSFKFSRFNEYDREETFVECYAFLYETNQQIETSFYYSNSIPIPVTISEVRHILIHENGRPTDYIIESDQIVGMYYWDNSATKVHIRYSNFDKRGNWRSQYYLRKKGGKKLRIKRKIKYG